MPAYGAAGWPKALNLGDVLTLITPADTAAGNVQKGVAITPTPSADGSVRNITIYNTTNQTCTWQQAAVDADGNYIAAYNGTAVSIPTNEAVTVPFGGPFGRPYFATAPTSGSLSVAG